MAAGQTGNSYPNVHDTNGGIVRVCITSFTSSHSLQNVAIEFDKRSNNLICQCLMHFAIALCLVPLAWYKCHFNILHSRLQIGQKLVN